MCPKSMILGVPTIRLAKAPSICPLLVWQNQERNGDVTKILCGVLLLAVLVCSGPVPVRADILTDNPRLEENALVSCQADQKRNRELDIDETLQDCVYGEIAAYRILASYPDEFRDFIIRCHGHYQKYGWDMVMYCAQKDIAAYEALAGYGDEHEAIIARCKLEKAGVGGGNRWADLKECVDEDITAYRNLELYGDEYQAFIDGCKKRDKSTFVQLSWDYILYCVNHAIEESLK